LVAHRQSLVFTQENVLATTFEAHISGPSVRDQTLPSNPYQMVALFLGFSLYKMDNSFSVIGAEKSANFPDDKAMGFVFTLDAASGREATITYLSGVKDILKIVQEGLFPAPSDPDSIKDLRMITVKLLEESSKVHLTSFIRSLCGTSRLC
jgi:hypothetical protein